MVAVNQGRPSQWHHNERDGVSNLTRTIVYSTVYSGTDIKTLKLRVTGLCEGNSPVTGEFLAQRASNAANVTIWWRQHAYVTPYLIGEERSQATRDNK